MQEVEPYHFKAIGQAKQNVRGGQVLALNLFDEANGKVQNVITDMQALAMIAPGKEPPTPASSCIVVLAVLAGATGSATMGLWHALA